jgi:hypothetical protein
MKEGETEGVPMTVILRVAKNRLRKELKCDPEIMCSCLLGVDAHNTAPCFNVGNFKEFKIFFVWHDGEISNLVLFKRWSISRDEIDPAVTDIFQNPTTYPANSWGSG